MILLYIVIIYNTNINYQRHHINCFEITVLYHDDAKQFCFSKCHRSLIVLLSFQLLTYLIIFVPSGT